MQIYLLLLNLLLNPDDSDIAFPYTLLTMRGSVLPFLCVLTYSWSLDLIYNKNNWLEMISLMLYIPLMMYPFGVFVSGLYILLTMPTIKNLTYNLYSKSSFALLQLTYKLFGAFRAAGLCIYLIGQYLSWRLSYISCLLRKSQILNNLFYKPFYILPLSFFY